MADTLGFIEGNFAKQSILITTEVATHLAFNLNVELNLMQASVRHVQLTITTQYTQLKQF